MHVNILCGSYAHIHIHTYILILRTIWNFPKKLKDRIRVICNLIIPYYFIYLLLKS